MAKTLYEKIYTIDSKNVCIPGDIVKDATKQLTIFDKSYNKNVPGKISGFLRTNASIEKKLNALYDEIQDPIKILTFYNCYFRDCRNSGDVSAPLKKISKKLDSVANFIGASGSESIATKGVIGIVKGKRNLDENLNKLFNNFLDLRNNIKIFLGKKDKKVLPDYVDKMPDNFELSVLSVPKVNTMGAVTSLLGLFSNAVATFYDYFFINKNENIIKKLKGQLEKINIESLFKIEEFTTSYSREIPSYANAAKEILENAGKTYTNLHFINSSFKDAFDLSLKNKNKNSDEIELLIGQYTQNRTETKNRINDLNVTVQGLEILTKGLKNCKSKDAYKAYLDLANFEKEVRELLKETKFNDYAIRTQNIKNTKKDGYDYTVTLNNLSTCKKIIPRDITNIYMYISFSGFSYENDLIPAISETFESLSNMKNNIYYNLKYLRPVSSTVEYIDENQLNEQFKKYNDNIENFNSKFLELKRKSISMQINIRYAAAKVAKEESITNLNNWLLNAEKVGLLAGLGASLCTFITRAVRAATGGSK